MQVQRGLRDRSVGADTSEFAVVVSADLAGHDLLARVQAALGPMYETWERESDTGPDGPAPQFGCSLAPPDVVVTVDKITDPYAAFDRLVAALQASLPPDARLRPLPPITMPASRESIDALISIRAALTAQHGRGPTDWTTEPGVMEHAHATAVDWIRETRPAATVWLQPLFGRATIVTPGNEDAAMRSQHESGQSYVQVVAGWANQYRTVKFWYPTAHVSFTAGTTDPPTFDWAAYLADVERALAAIEPVTHLAFATFAEQARHTGTAANATRNSRLPTPLRRMGTPDVERCLEDIGLVDAYGRAYLPHPPDGLPPDWDQQPFGHLTQFTAPNLADWLAHEPTLDVLQAGRNALATMLSEPDTEVGARYT
jgi:hypothetical protein